MLLSTKEDFIYNYLLHSISKFHFISEKNKKICTQITLNFGFKDIKFEKKFMILHFFLLELLTAQKCVITISRKNIISLKIKKGAITGCKITLRGLMLESFLETLLLALPRQELFKGFSFKIFSNKYNAFSTSIKTLFIFYTLEVDITPFITKLDLTFKFNTLCDFEKRFFFTYAKLPLNYFS